MEEFRSNNDSLMALTPSNDLSSNARSRYAQRLQRTCDEALRDLRRQHVINTTAWAAPLTAAPSAISVMAILLKAADAKAASGLKINNLDIIDDGKVIGRLPSEYFHTDLQHCADVGRIAFLEAQNGMNLIRAISQRMIGEGGQVSCIVDLLEVPEDAKYDLVPEVDSIKASAARCLQTAQNISRRFTYWHRVITHLGQCSLERHDIVIREQADVEEDKARTSAAQVEWGEKRLALEATIVDLRKKLSDAESRLDNARVDLDTAQAAVLMMQPSTFEMYAKAEATIPPAIRRSNPGFFKKCWSALFGDSDSGKSEAERRAEVDRLVSAEREACRQRKDAAQIVYTKALEEKQKLDKAIDEAYEGLSLSQNRLAEAKANLESSKIQMERLQAKAVELTDIESILKKSSDQLAKLKEQIEPLVVFFDGILVGIEQGISENVDAFLRPIKSRIGGDTADKEEMDVLRLGQAAKRNMTGAALRMQGHFSAISDISEAYIAISSNYIRPAINRMESLARCNDGDWQAQSEQFIADCHTWSHEIEALARRTTTQAPLNMKRHMGFLQQRAIEAAEDA